MTERQFEPDFAHPADLQKWRHGRRSKRWVQCRHWLWHRQAAYTIRGIQFCGAVGYSECGRRRTARRLSQYSGSIVNRPTFFASPVKSGDGRGRTGGNITAFRRGATVSWVSWQPVQEGWRCLRPSTQTNNDAGNDRYGPQALSRPYITLEKKPPLISWQQQSRDGVLLEEGDQWKHLTGRSALI